MQKAMKPVAGISQIRDKQWPTASEHREFAEKAAHILRILATTSQPPDRSMQEDDRGTLLDTYG
jgi:hypothetical protein